MFPITHTLSTFVSNPGFNDLLEKAFVIAKIGFVDTIATMIAGRDDSVVRMIHQFIRDKKTTACEAKVFPMGEMLLSADAALINGTAAHALDYDDVALGGHPSTVLVPAVLAEGQRLGASGAQVLCAYLVGYEVWAELFYREPDAYHVKGWHPTAVFGTVGAAAAAAYLNRLDPNKSQHALAIAASMASGLVSNFGTMMKPVHAGRAAASGIEAVRLAINGLTASPDAIEHHAGLLAALSPNGRVDLDSPVMVGAGKFRIFDFGLSVKKYPMCYATHRVIDGVLDMVDAQNINPSEIKEVRTTVGVAQASMLRNHSPKTGLEAKFSMEFAVASAIVERRVGLRELTDSFVERPEVRKMMAKVKITTVDTHCPIEPLFALTDRVVIYLNDGRSFDSGEIRFPRGNAMLPLGEKELRNKFMDCTAGVSGLDRVTLYECLSNLEAIGSVRDLT